MAKSGLLFGLSWEIIFLCWLSCCWGFVLLMSARFFVWTSAGFISQKLPVLFAQNEVEGRGLNFGGIYGGKLLHWICTQRRVDYTKYSQVDFAQNSRGEKSHLWILMEMYLTQWSLICIHLILPNGRRIVSNLQRQLVSNLLDQSSTVYKVWRKAMRKCLMFHINLSRGLSVSRPSIQSDTSPLSDRGTEQRGK